MKSYLESRKYSGYLENVFQGGREKIDRGTSLNHYTKNRTPESQVFHVINTRIKIILMVLQHEYFEILHCMSRLFGNSEDHKYIFGQI